MIGNEAEEPLPKLRALLVVDGIAFADVIEDD